MRTNYSAIALALITASATAQNCPTGYQRATVSWYNCPVEKIFNLQCSTIEVPLDYSQPTGKALKLRLVRIPAATPNAQTKSVIYNPGGPGDVGIGALIGDGYGLDIQKIVGTEFNLIGFDPRGTGLSIPFGCESIDHKNTDGDLKDMYDALSKQADECAKKDFKIDNELMGTAYVARDIKAISEAIGEDNLIRYIGYSYGTLLGATTAAMFPDSIGRMMLDGNINFQDYYYGLGNEAVANVDNAVARFFDLCSEAGPRNCAVAVGNQTGAQLRQRYDDFLRNLTYAQSYAVRSGFFGSLYDPSTFKNQAVWLGKYYNDPALIARRSLRRRADDDEEDEDDVDTANDAWKPTQSLDIETDMTLAAVTCGDWVVNPEASVETFKDWRDTWRATSRYGGDLALLSTLYQCSLWKNDAKEKYTGPFANIKTKNPILFINTPYDPVTPLASAKNSSASFVNSRLLVSSGGGHCSNKQPSKELNVAIKKYFLDASFPAGSEIYTPDRPNSFISTPANSTKTTKKKRKISHAQLFKAESVIVKRQTMVPVGCVKSNSTLPGSNSTNSTGHGYSQNGAYSSGSSQSVGSGAYFSSTRSDGYDDYSGSTRSAAYGDYSGSTRSPGYGDSQDNYYGSSRPTQSAGYNAYGGYGSNPSSKRPTTMTSAPTSVPSVPCTTSTITETTYETITKCSNDYNCRLGSIATRPNVRTTVITLTVSVPAVSGTPFSYASGTPGQGYNVPPKSVNVDGSRPGGNPQSVAFNFGYDSPAKPSTTGVVNDVIKSTPTAVTPPGTYGVPNRPISVGMGSNGTAAVNTPTRNYPAQFTGGAVSQYGMRVLLPVVVASVATFLAL